jgi:hypothetical protein
MGGLAVLLVAACLLIPILWERARPAVSACSLRATRALLLPFSFAPGAARFRSWAGGVRDPGSLDPLGLWSYAGRHYRLVFLPLGILLMALARGRDPGPRHSRRLDMWGLLENNSREFPCLLPILRSGPITAKPQGHGEWALAQGPLQFAAANRLLLIDQSSRYGPWQLMDEATGMARLDSPCLKGSLGLDIEGCAYLFARQAGRRFDGAVGDLPVYRRALALAFMAHYDDQKDLAFSVFDALSSSWDPKTHGVEVPGLAALGERYGGFSHPELTLHQAFENVWFMALLRLARRKGSLPSSLWIWLKPTDRTLFYVLNQVGGRAAWCEGAGAWSHFLKERDLGRAVGNPVVGQALRSLEAALIQEGWIPKDIALRADASHTHVDTTEPEMTIEEFRMEAYDEMDRDAEAPGGEARPFPYLTKSFGRITKGQAGPPVPFGMRGELAREKARERARAKGGGAPGAGDPGYLTLGGNGPPGGGGGGDMPDPPEGPFYEGGGADLREYVPSPPEGGPPQGDPAPGDGAPGPGPSPWEAEGPAWGEPPPPGAGPWPPGEGGGGPSQGEGPGPTQGAQGRLGGEAGKGNKDTEVGEAGKGNKDTEGGKGGKAGKAGKGNPGGKDGLEDDRGNGPKDN